MIHQNILAIASVLCGAITIGDAQTSTTAAETSTTSFRSIFTVPASADSPAPLIPNIYDPQAVNAQDACPGYNASNVQKSQSGFTATLMLAGPACNIYGNDVDTLNLTVEYQSSDRLHVEIIPSNIDTTNSSWFVIPEVIVTKPAVDEDFDDDNDLDFVWSNDPTFSFTVIRKETGDVLFSTAGTKLVFEDQFVEFKSSLPEEYNLYGLGEVIHGLRMGTNLTRTFYAADVGDPIDRNLYGDQPFYLDTRYYQVNDTTGNLTYVSNTTASNHSQEYVSYSHGVYFRNAHGQELLMQGDGITWRTIGGSIDLFFYSGPTQDKVTRSYIQSAAGLPAMQSYWTFGYHQCRWGYQNWTVLQSVVDDFQSFNIPLETIWTDIDYMDQYRDFTVDENTFPVDEGKQFLSQLHEGGRHYVPIIDSAIYVPNPGNSSDAYPTFDRGNASDSFLLNPEGDLYIGSVWPGYTVFPDWIGAILNGTGASEWWKDEFSRWHQDIAFDGAWIDMNEASSFCMGSCGSGNLSLNPVHPPFQLPGEVGNQIFSYPEGFNLTNATEAETASSLSASQSSANAKGAAPAASTSTSYLRTTPTPGVRQVLYPPYTINHVQLDLSTHAVAPNATHHGGTIEYDYHNLWGTSILNATYHALLNISSTKRPFIIGRSTFVGSGKWAGHWGGDNASLWAYMYFSISQALSFSLFGIPMFGVDTCGFNGNTDEELCNRWMQLSAFFPFYRNHNTLSANSQEPYRWASVAEASRTAMSIRYALLPYIYTTFHKAHKSGSTVMRALAWEFPHDPSLAAVDNQFLFGSSLLITPVLAQGATNVSGVFPGVGKGDVWYDWYNQSAISAGPGENITIDAPLGHIPVFVRGGSILPLQGTGLTTRECRSKPWSLIVASGLGGSATGELYVDDGESLKPNATLWVDFSLTNSTLYASARGTYNDTNPLANVTVLGVQSNVSSITLNGANLTSGWSWNDTNQVLSIANLTNATSDGAWADDWVLKWT